MRDTSGPSSSESFASYDPDSSSLRTSQLSLLTGQQSEFSATLPRSGTMRNGVLCQRPPWVRLTDASESSLWATPTANPSNATTIKAALVEAARLHPHGRWTLLSQVAAEMVHGDRMWPTPTASLGGSNATAPTLHGNGGGRHGINLAGSVKLWPTPTASDAYMEGRVNSAKTPYVTANGTVRERREDGRSSNLGLAGMAKLWATMWPTPTVSDLKDTPGTTYGARHATDQLPRSVFTTEGTPPHGGVLNPTFVEWLMGFPLSWTALPTYRSDPRRRIPRSGTPVAGTDSKRSATPSSRRSRKSSGDD